MHRCVELPRHQAAADSVRAIADRSGYRQPTTATRVAAAGRRRAAGARAAASTCRRSTSTTWRSRSTRCWRRSASACSTPRSTCSREALPFLYGGDMIAEGQVAPDHVDYNDLPWKYAAGTPNILGVIASAEALRLLVDLVGAGRAPRWFDIDRAAATVASSQARWTASPSTPVADRAGHARRGDDRRPHGLRAGGRRRRGRRCCRSTVDGIDPMRLAEALDLRRRRGARRLPLRHAGAPRPRSRPRRRAAGSASPSTRAPTTSTGPWTPCGASSSVPGHGSRDGPQPSADDRDTRDGAVPAERLVTPLVDPEAPRL